MKQALTGLIVVVQAGIVLAAEAIAQANGASATFFGASVLAAGLGVGIAAGGCGIGIGMVFASTLQGIARQPELQGKLFSNMMIGFALIEAQVLYVFFLAIIFLFANPFKALFVS